jgi:hypothetical protein
METKELYIIGSTALNIVLAGLAWLWFRKREIMIAIDKYETAMSDGNMTPEERIDFINAIVEAIDKKQV